MLAIDLLVNGLIFGLFYALMAVGLAMIFGVLKVVNFAHGEFYMLGAYAYVLVSLKLGVSPWIALPIAAAVGAAVGWLVERTLMRPLYSGYASWSIMKDEYAVVVTFGLSLLLINLVDKVVGPYPMRGPELIETTRFSIGPIMLNGQKLIAAGISLAVLIGLALFIKKSLWGRQIQAVAQNRLGASLAGIDATRTTSMIFAIAGLLAALSGALLAPVINPSPDIGAFPAIKSYVIVVLGGMGSIWGAMIAALLLGVFEAFFAVYVSYAYRDAFGLLLLILVLIFRPQGLFGEKGREV
ncbi:branched-chain amino acid ABC transporter permease [Actimicrobium sp. CCI2.3]|uniref:branched-chain amino acid ABC transporter permease n=1 Tax=Actimicrobium sp. CCI2.3 TaxID=3048616 RepID=UPI002AB36C55|nr:branched-chain amino acid ABC transporter permease [Actimicrobium sp. CCI2.3]MDY7573048.1 branched-chain amino acid ABC transporter permease [Actimicrobium sp. CCI2.3]MEB0020846.1 branched-chain amino acid ABC transporter permease [Actimicrobium sp. CCI2.3]